jgi:cation:H+ antiporter
MSEALIGLTIVAAGTSLPELAATIIASLKKENDMAYGNIVGSNIFNILGILGISAVIAPIKNSGVRLIDFGMMLLIAILLYAFSYFQTKLSRLSGFFFLFYI